MTRQAISNTEVVITALGIRKEKAKISYATQEVKGAALEKAPEPNIAQNMIGKVAKAIFSPQKFSIDVIISF